MTLLDLPSAATTLEQDRSDRGPAGQQPTPTFQQRQRQREKERRARLVTERLERLQREKLILDAAASGASMRSIARELQISPTTVCKIYDDALARIEADNLGRHIPEARLRLNRLLLAVWSKALDGDLQAVGRAQSIVSDLIRLAGGYPAQKVEVSGRVEHVDLDTFTASIEFWERQAAELEAQQSQPRALAPGV